MEDVECKMADVYFPSATSYLLHFVSLIYEYNAKNARGSVC